jgi:hypothetical protein
MPRLKLQLEAIQVVSFEPGSDGVGVQEISLRCTVETCMVTGGIDSCWCSEYASCDCV